MNGLEAVCDGWREIVHSEWNEKMGFFEGIRWVEATVAANAEFRRMSLRRSLNLALRLKLKRLWP